MDKGVPLKGVEEDQSESLAQIRMLNDAINLQKNLPSNYSPDASHDLSDSLKDFSLGGADKGAEV